MKKQTVLLKIRFATCLVFIVMFTVLYIVPQIQRGDDGVGREEVLEHYEYTHCQAEEVTEEAVEDQTETDQLPPVIYYPLSEYEYSIVLHVVAGEARGESIIGQMLVAQCIYNSCAENEQPPSEIVKEYKYSGWSDDITESVKQAVSRVFNDGNKAIDENIKYFYSTAYCEGKWHEKALQFVIAEGAHKFFKERT